MPKFTVFNDHKFLSLLRINAPLPEDPKYRTYINEAPAIIYNISGRKTIMIEGCSYRVNPGELVLLKPIEAFHIVEDEEELSDYAIIYFNRSFFRPYDPELKILRRFEDRRIGENNVICFDEQQNALFQACIKHMEKNLGMNEHYISFVGMLMLIVNEINSCTSLKTGINNPEGRDILLYINEDFSRDLRTKTLSQRFHMCESTFCKYFKNLTGMSPKSYVTRKRVLQARILLNRNVKIDDVMAQCGFGDYTTFYKAHAKYYNYPPSDNYARGGYDPLFLKGIPPLDMERMNEGLKIKA